MRKYLIRYSVRLQQKTKTPKGNHCEMLCLRQCTKHALCLVSRTTQHQRHTSSRSNANHCTCCFCATPVCQLRYVLSTPPPGPRTNERGTVKILPTVDARNRSLRFIKCSHHWNSSRDEMNLFSFACAFITTFLNCFVFSCSIEGRPRNPSRHPISLCLCTNIGFI